MDSDDEVKEKKFQKQIEDMVNMMHKITQSTKVVRAMNKFEASYHEDPIKIVEQAAHKCYTWKNLNSLIYLTTTAIVAEDFKPTKDEPLMFNEALIILILSHEKNDKRPLKGVQQHKKTTGVEEDTLESYAHKS